MSHFTRHLCFLLLTIIASSRNATIFGPLFATSLFRQLRQTFTLSDSSNINYVGINQSAAEANDYLRAGDPVLVNSLINLSTSTVRIPMFGFSIAVVHSVPVVSLNLTQNMLLDILLRKIGDWNHTDLTTINANLTGDSTSAPITVFVGSLLDRVLEAMSEIANRTIDRSEINHKFVGETVCSNVKATPYSIGFAWLGDVIEQNSQIAFVMNKYGALVLPTMGVASAVSEFFTTKNFGVTTPYNMPGKLAWPFTSILYLALPSNFADCAKLLVVQDFVSLVMFQTSNMDLFVRALGWEPVKSTSIFDNVLGKVTSSDDYHDILFSVQCAQNQTSNFYTLGTSARLATSILKPLAAYTATVFPNIRMLSADSGIQDYLNAMSDRRTGRAAVDMSFTWAHVLKTYPKLTSVPVYMGGIVVYFNLPNITSIVLDQDTLVEIFSGKIGFWNDSQIQALNLGVDLPFHPIYIFAAADDTIADGSTALFSGWLRSASPSFSWSQVKSSLFTPKEGDIRKLVSNVRYAIGYGAAQFIVPADNVARLIGSDGKPITFSSNALAECWRALDSPKCWPAPFPLAMVIAQPINCAHQQPIVAFVDWVIRKARNINQYLVPNPSVKLGAAEFCAGRSLLRTIPEPQTISVGVQVSVAVFAIVGMMLAVMQAVALWIARNRSELKAASVLFSFLAVIGVFFIFAASLMIVQENPTKLACGSSMWLLCLGYTFCYGSLFAKLFRLYLIFTTRKLVVPRLSNRRLLWMVSIFLIVDIILLVIYSTITPAEPFEFFIEVPSSDDYVTGHRKFTLEMCSFHVDSPVLHLILACKCGIALGGSMMAFSIRQVDRRFTSISALGWSFYNMFVTVAIVIIISVSFDYQEKLQTPLMVLVYGGLWIMYVTTCALTLDSNVLLACKDFSKPLRKLLSAKQSKDSRDATKTSAEKDQDPESLTKQSHSSTLFVVNREMFPSKYDGFDPELLEKILQELKHQSMAVRRVIHAGPAVADTAVELSPVNSDGRRSTKADSRLSSRSKNAPLSVDVFGGASSQIIITAASTPEDGPPAPPADWRVVSDMSDPKLSPRLSLQSNDSANNSKCGD